MLFGQAIVRFVSGLLLGGKAAAAGPVALLLATVVVFGLTPSLMILSMMLTQAHPSAWLQLSQVLLFFAATLVYTFLSVVGESWKQK